MDTLDLDHSNDTPSEQPALQALPRILPLKQPTAQSMMLAQQQRIAENVGNLDADLNAMYRNVQYDLAEIKATLSLFMRDVLIALGVIFVLVVLALLARG